MALYISIVAPADAWCVLPFPEQKVQVALRVLTKARLFLCELRLHSQEAT